MLKKLCAVICLFVSVAGITVNAAQSITVKLNGDIVNFENKTPLVKDNRTLIPLRGLFEKMGYTIEWEPNTKAAILSKGGNTISIRADKNYILVNNIQKTIDVPAQIIDGYMMIPLRAVADATGAQVNWDSANKIAGITTTLDQEYVVSINEYTKAYNEAIEPLSILKGLSSKLSSINSNTTEEQIKSIIEELNETKSVILSVKENVAKLQPGEKFADFHNTALTAMDKQIELCDILVTSLTEEKNYAEISKLVSNILNDAKSLNAELDNYSFIL